MLLAIRYAVVVAPKVAPYLDRFVDLPPSLREPIVVFAGGCLIAVAAYLVARIAHGLVLHSMPQWKGIDRWLGAALGAVQGVIISLILLFSLLVLEPIAQRHLAGAQSGAEWSLLPMSAKVVNWSAKVRLSSVGVLMDEMEPLRLRFNDRLQHLTETISAEAMQEPTIQAMLPDFIEGLHNNPRASRTSRPARASTSKHCAGS